MNRSRAPFSSVLACVCSLSLPLALASACGSVPGDASDVPPSDETEAVAEALRVRPPAFLDVTEMFSGEDDQNRWFDLTFGLRQDFDDICGDTFCEGDFSNLQSMSFQCSASTRTGQLKSCLWLFAGSAGTVTASTGNIRPGGKFFACSIPVTGTAHGLLDALLAPDGERGPLWRPLPGTTLSIYDHLGDCL